MVDYIKLKQGLDIPVEGVPETRILKSIVSETVAVKPTDFKGLIPKLAVKDGDAVKAGSVLFFDKKRPEIRFTSPVSGTVCGIIRGEKRKLLEVRVKADPETEYAKFDLPKPEAATAEQVISLLLESGLWPCIKQRPYGIIPNPEVRPKALYISGFDSAPLAADYDYILKDEVENLQTAINVLSKVTPKIHFGLNAKTHASTPFHKLSGVEFHVFDGPHPAGNVGVQINHICPINKGDVVWTVNLQLLAIIGRFFSTQAEDAVRNNLLLFVTTRLVNNDGIPIRRNQRRSTALRRHPAEPHPRPRDGNHGRCGFSGDRPYAGTLGALSGVSLPPPAPDFSGAADRPPLPAFPDHSDH